MYFYLLFDTVRAFIKESLENHFPNLNSNIQVNYLISYQTNAILGMLIEWHRNEYKTPIQEMNEQLIMILSMNRSF